ncbi:MAG: DUF2079 domain-containing protein [Actinomycetes bacterium]
MTSTATSITDAGTDTLAGQPGSRVLSKLAWGVFALQFLILCVWSTRLWSHYALWADSATYLQAFHLISHGDLNPFSTTAGIPFFKDHFSLLLWPYAALDLLWPHGLLMFWAQDASVVAAEIVTFRWISKVISDLPRRSISDRLPTVLGGLGLVVMVANPWIYWSLSWDIHPEAFALPFIMAAAFDLSQGRTKRAWIWVVLTILMGDVCATWVFGLGISAGIAALMTRDRRRSLIVNAMALGVASLAWLAAIATLGGNKGSSFSTLYGHLAATPGMSHPKDAGPFKVLKGALLHPGRVVGTLWDQGQNISANLGPTAYIGILTPWTIGVPLIVILANNLPQQRYFSVPEFQSLPLYTFGAVGLIMILAYVAGRWSWPTWAVGLCVFIAAINVMVWAAIFLPITDERWMQVASSKASILSKVNAMIPANDEVIVTRGVSGRFGERRQIRPYPPAGINVTSGYPVTTKTVWFVLAPGAGLYGAPPEEVRALMAQLAGPMHAKLVVAENGVFAFRWDRPEGVDHITLPTGVSSIPAWTVPGPVAASVRRGPASTWHLKSTGEAGALSTGSSWNRPTGRYVAAVEFEGRTPITVTVVNFTTGATLATRSLQASPTRTTQAVPFTLVYGVSSSHRFAGRWPFSIDPVRPSATTNAVGIVVSVDHGAKVILRRLAILPDGT